MPQKWSEITPLWRSNPFVVNWWSTMVVCAIFIFNSNKESPILSYMGLKSSPKVCYWAYHIIVIPILIMFIIYICVCICICIWICVYIYICVCVYVYIILHIYINRSKSRLIAWTYSQVPPPCFHKNLWWNWMEGFNNSRDQLGGLPGWRSFIMFYPWEVLLGNTQPH